jgi:uncharacterized protein YbbC (DUF1343 family)
MLTGIDLLSTGQASSLRRRLRTSRVGLLTHRAATDRHGKGTLEVLEELGATISLILTPEHGFDGTAQAEEPVSASNGTESSHGPIVSLYGTTTDALSPSEQHLSMFDVLVIDLVDVGTRYYTYAWTALLALRAAARNGVHTVVLDRPNPISGHPDTIEGVPQQPGLLSFVGLEPIAIRHALTIGEMLSMFAERDQLALGPDGALGVVGTAGWERYRTASSWARPFIAPSPNMPTVETALVYPGACLVEGTNLSEGRGTTQPFQCVGAPFLDEELLAKQLAAHGLVGAMVRPHVFRPTFGKFANEICRGVMVHVTDAMLFRPVATYAAIIALARAQAKERFEFLSRTYEYETSRLAFDLLAGNTAVREAILADRSTEDIVSLIAPVPTDQRPDVREAEARVQRASE